MKQDKLRPIAFVLASTNHGSLLVNRHDYRLVGDSGYGVGYQILKTSSFDPHEIAFALQLLESRRANYGDGVMALDCGANIGAHTIEWSHFMTGWGNVVAVEAQERIFYALAGNITINNCFNARAIWAALGSSAGTMGVPVADHFSPSSFGSLELRQSETNEYIGQNIDYTNLQLTAVVAVDDMQLSRLDLMKIDVEGMEMEVLQGARQTIAKTRPQLIVEKIKSNEAQLSEFLMNFGYRIFAMGINILAVHETDPVVNQIRLTSGTG